MLHRRDHDLVPVRQRKGRVVGCILGKRHQPGGLEMGGIGEDQGRGRVQGARRQQFVDSAFGLLTAPVVDLLPCRLCLPEIDQVHPGAIVLSQGVKEGHQERLSLLAPKGIDAPQVGRLWFILTPAGQGQVQRVERSVQVSLGQAKAQGLGHLPFGLAPRPGVGHGQCHAEAVR